MDQAITQWINSFAGGALQDPRWPLSPEVETLRRIAERLQGGERGSRRRVDYSITSSAAMSSVGGTVMPSAFSVLRLTTSSNLDNCRTGNSAGFSPFKMRPT